MKKIILNYKKTSRVSPARLESLFNILMPEIKNLAHINTNNYTTKYACIPALFDYKNIKLIQKTAQKMRTLHPTIFLIIGIGGSNLGTLAVLQALRGKFYNHHHSIRTYFVDTLDTDYISDIIQLVHQELSNGNTIIINVISKSGETTETIANFEIFLTILKYHRPDNYHNFIVVTTNKNSPLWKLAQKEKFTQLEIPELIGGRYSVFSAVGLFPLSFLDIDIIELIKGARDGYCSSITDNLNNNPAAQSAAIIFYHYIHKTTIHDSFIFSIALEQWGAWYRQLCAESLGKAYNNDNKLVNTGILPTISIGSTDLHSVAQLYLAGPRNRFTTFITIKSNNSSMTVPNNKEIYSFAPFIQNKTVMTIMNAITQGTQAAYYNDARPFMSIQIPEKSAYYIGQLMQIKMIEIIYLGFLLHINPFDQPAVELYKKETKKILSD